MRLQASYRCDEGHEYAAVYTIASIDSIPPTVNCPFIIWESVWGQGRPYDARPHGEPAKLVRLAMEEEVQRASYRNPSVPSR